MEVTLDTTLEFIRSYGHWIVFVWLTLENTLFLGVVAPGLTVLLAAGVLLHTGDLGGPAAILAALSGVWVGDTINFVLGRYGLRRFGWVRRVLQHNDDVHGFIKRYPEAVYVFFQFPVYLRTLFPLTLGAMHTPWRTWLRIDAIATPLFVGAYMGLGYGLARFVLEISDLEAALHQILRAGNVVALGFSVLFAYGTYRFVRVLVKSARSPSAEAFGESPADE